MWAAHVIAGLVTIVLLHQGERVGRLLLGTARALARRVAAVLGAPTLTRFLPARRGGLPTRRPGPVLVAQLAASVRPLRGPPLPALV